MILVTGGAGFIGSHLVETLNRQGVFDIFIVDHFGTESKLRNLGCLRFQDFLDKVDFRRQLAADKFSDRQFRKIYHLGACTSTVESNADYMMDNNYMYSKELLHFALKYRIPFIYASSAGVYGGSTTFLEEPEYERPLNYYGKSKLALDNCVRQLLCSARTTVVGLRLFNVYGPREAHKGRMSSVIYQFLKQARESGTIQIFKGSGGYSDGEQRRDFVYVGDVVKVILKFGEEKLSKGIFNVGMGRSRSFNEVAQAVLAVVNGGHIEYIDFPEDLRGKYQNCTQADLNRLKAAGGPLPATELESGVAQMAETASELPFQNI